MLSKKDLINRVYEKNTFSKKAVGQIVDAFIAELCSAIESGEEVRIYELGTFKFTHRSAYAIPGTRYRKAPMQVPERVVPRLQFNQCIKRTLNKTD